MTNGISLEQIFSVFVCALLDKDTWTLAKTLKWVVQKKKNYTHNKLWQALSFFCCYFVLLATFFHFSLELRVRRKNTGFEGNLCTAHFSKTFLLAFFLYYFSLFFSKDMQQRRKKTYDSFSLQRFAPKNHFIWYTFLSSLLGTRSALNADSQRSSVAHSLPLHRCPSCLPIHLHVLANIDEYR